MEDDFEQLRERFESLAKGDSLPGAQEIARGLSSVAAYCAGHCAAEEQQRYALLVHGLGGIADLLDPSPPQDLSPPTDGSSALDHLIATFRGEASKRLQGLSISMMGIFGDANVDEALETSADHLHALRGGAAMLELQEIAALAGEMENLLKISLKRDPTQRQWPANLLLRGFAMLEKAVHSPSMALDADAVEQVVVELRRHAQGPAQDTPAADNDSGDSSSEVSTESFTVAPPSSLEQPILVVDDVDTIAASVAFILSDLEVPIEVASNGEEAMQLLQQRPFSLVISDVDMPRMDGIALTRMIRSSDELSRLPVILLTSLDHPEERKAGMDAGASDYIIKGAIGGGELVRRVRDFLEVAPVVERELVQLRSRILVAEDTETVAASIAFVLSEGPFEIELAGNGREALKKLERRDYDLLITDMQMPFVDGTELVATLRQDLGLLDLPVVMLTSVEDSEMVARAHEAGVDRYLKKGEVAGGKLLTIVNELLVEAQSD